MHTYTHHTHSITRSIFDGGTDGDLWRLVQQRTMKGGMKVTFGAAAYGARVAVHFTESHAQGAMQPNGDHSRVTHTESFYLMS